MKGWASQSGEDRTLARIFRAIGTTNQHAVEFGAIDGEHGSNTAYFRHRGWTVTLFDRASLSPLVQQVTITAENINDVFHEAGVPKSFDLLSIDIDGNDLWVWKALRFRPRVVVIEYNPRWGYSKSRTVTYDPDRLWDGTNYYGASALALARLAKAKGYALAAATRSNLIFVERGRYPRMSVRSIRRPVKLKRDDPQRRKWVTYP